MTNNVNNKLLTDYPDFRVYNESDPFDKVTSIFHKSIKVPYQQEVSSYYENGEGPKTEVTLWSKILAFFGIGKIVETATKIDKIAHLYLNTEIPGETAQLIEEAKAYVMPRIAHARL